MESARGTIFRPRFAAPVVAAAALLVYVNALGNGFVWDDPIILNRQLVVFDSVRDVLLTPRNIPQYSPDYYRPLTTASLLLDRAVGGHHPFVYHLSVVLAHVLTSVLVCLLAGTFYPGRAAAGYAGMAAGLLFALHPVHTESVAWIAGRSDVLATLFVLAAIVVHRRNAASWGASLASGLCVLAGLGAKETALAAVPLMLVCDLLAPRPVAGRETGADRWWRQYAGPALALAAYLLLRRAALGDVVGRAAADVTVTRSLIDLIGAVGAYAVKLVWPLGLNAYIDDVPHGALAIGATLAGLAAALGGAVWRWRRGDALPLLCLAWMCLTLAPSLAIVWKIPEAPIAERYLYLPSVGLCLLVGHVFAGFTQSARGASARPLAMVAGVVVLVLAAAMTSRRNAVWHDDLALWRDTVRKSRVAGLPMRSLATALQHRGEAEEARRHFELALQRHNGSYGLQVIYSNLGTLALHAGDATGARQYYLQALQGSPDAPDTLFNLGLATLQAGGATAQAAGDALPFLQRAEALSPYDADIHAALGQVLAIRGERERAVRHLQRALQLNPAPATAQSIRNYLREVSSD